MKSILLILILGDQIIGSLRELINSKITTSTTTTTKPASETVPKELSNTTIMVSLKSVNNITSIASIVEPGISAAILSGNKSSFQENPRLSQGSSGE